MYARVEPEYHDTSHLDDLTDADLVRSVKRGHDAALEVLLRRHSDALYRFCCHLTSSREDAEDVCQESMARAITRVDTLQEGSAFRSWLFSIARNLAMDSYRARKRVCPLPDEEITPLPLYEDNPQDRIEISEEHQTVAEALGKLAQSHQKVLVLREVEGLSYAQIASKLDVSQSAVETLLFRARRRLKEEYGKRAMAVPGAAFMPALRALLTRVGAPLTGGVPLATKVAVTAVVLGGAVAAPHVMPIHHFRFSLPALSTSHHAAAPVILRHHQHASPRPSAARLVAARRPALTARAGAVHPGRYVRHATTRHVQRHAARRRHRLATHLARRATHTRHHRRRHGGTLRRMLATTGRTMPITQSVARPLAVNGAPSSPAVVPVSSTSAAAPATTGGRTVTPSNAAATNPVPSAPSYSAPQTTAGAVTGRNGRAGGGTAPGVPGNSAAAVVNAPASTPAQRGGSVNTGAGATSVGSSQGTGVVGTPPGSAPGATPAQSANSAPASSPPTTAAGLVMAAAPGGAGSTSAPGSGSSRHP